MKKKETGRQIKGMSFQKKPADTLPAWENPMKAIICRHPFSDPGWIFERKLDGERCITFSRGNRCTLYSRNHRSITQTYPEIAGAMENQDVESYISDGEIVAFEGKRTSFSKLQNRMNRKYSFDDDPAGGISVYYYLFDLFVFKRL